jgi:hypothetical protein
MNDFFAALKSPVARIRVEAADELGRLHGILAESQLRDLLVDSSPVVTYRGKRAGIGEVRFTALTALQRILLHHDKPMDLVVVVVRKVMFADDVEDDVVRGIAPRVDEILRDRVQPDDEDLALVRPYLVLQCLDRIDYRREPVDPITYATPLQEEVRASQLVSPRPRPHLRVADAANAERVFGYVYRNDRGFYTLDFAEGPGSDRAVWILSAILQSRLNAVVLVDGETARNPDGTAQLGDLLNLRTADPVLALQSLRVYVERRYHTTIVT